MAATEKKKECRQCKKESGVSFNLWAHEIKKEAPVRDTPGRDFLVPPPYFQYYFGAAYSDTRPETNSFLEAAVSVSF